MKTQLIKNYPIASISLFGSIVRDDFTAESDIGIIVDFKNKMGIEFITLADELEHGLNHRVDLVSRGGIKPKYFSVIGPEITYI